jgi:glycosyltransferase involved in cell wall biosynthesis
MTRLGIFTVKKICRFNGNYYTYGGFGDYLAAMRAAFPKVVMVAHLKESTPPEGYYLIPPGDDLEVVGLPQVKTELGMLLIMPVIAWRCWLATKKMDIAHARMPNHTGVIGAFACDLRGVPVFCQIIDDWYLAARRMPWMRKFGLGLPLKLHLYLYDWLERMVCRGKLVFAQGQSCYEKHVGHSDCELVLSTAHYLHDIIPPRQRFVSKPYTILTVARLTGVKNQQLTIRALAKLLAEGQEWRCVFVGDGPHKASLVQLAKELNVESHVHFAGQAARGDALWQYFDAADCFVLSSRSEGTPKVLLEAMARGLPIIATAVAGIPTSVKHEERGLLIEDNDVNGLVAAAKRLAGDPAFSYRLAQNASEFCKAHTVENATASMLRKVVQKWPQFKDVKL